jgi:hypothetical protein
MKIPTLLTVTQRVALLGVIVSASGLYATLTLWHRSPQAAGQPPAPDVSAFITGCSGPILWQPASGGTPQERFVATIKMRNNTAQELDYHLLVNGVAAASTQTLNSDPETFTLDPGDIITTTYVDPSASDDAQACTFMSVQAVVE